MRAGARALACAAALGCADAGSPRDDAPRNPTATAPASRATATPTPFRLGVAVADSAARWCASFDDADTIPAARVGDRVTVVWADSRARRASGLGRVARIRRGGCGPFAADSAFAYELALDDPVSAAERPAVAHALLGASTWRFGAHQWAHGDADRDGVEEIARACTSQEGYHLTLWRQRPGAPPTLWAHRYHYLGYDVEPSCTDEETEDVRAEITRPYSDGR